MTTNRKSPKIIFGSMTFGKPDTMSTRIHDAGEAKKLLDIFQARGHNQVDTARLYGLGSTEEMLAEIGWQKRDIVLATKSFPTALMPNHLPGGYTFRPESLRTQLMESLKALQTDSVDTFYLHIPDRSVPLEEAARGVNELHKQGYFKHFGLSNYTAWEVASMCEICKKNGWVEPTVYQGVYNAIQRSPEPELFPCLRHYGIAFHAYSPLAGGFLSSRYKRDKEVKTGDRYNANTLTGSAFRARYWKDAYFDAIEMIESAAKKHRLTIAEVAMRWLVHHSQLKESVGDGIIIGASSVEQLERNLADLEKGSLPEDVVEALDSAWVTAKAYASNYFQ